MLRSSVSWFWIHRKVVSCLQKRNVRNRPLKKFLSLRDVTFTRPACTPDVCTYNVYIYIYIYKAKVGKQELPIALFLFKK